jgi:hypothetical protein
MITPRSGFHSKREEKQIPGDYGRYGQVSEGKLGFAPG